MPSAIPLRTSNKPTTARDAGVTADTLSRQATGKARPPRPKPSITGTVPNPNNAMEIIPAHAPPAVAAKATAA